MDALPSPVPIERLEVGLVLVPIRSPDGEPMAFILDTGAGITVLTPSAAARLGVSPGRTVDAQAIGGTVPVALGTLDELRVGDAVLEDLDVAVLELPRAVVVQLGRPVDGVLGRSFFEQADVTLDVGASALTLHPPGSLADEREGGVRFRLPGGVVEVRADLGDARRLRAVLDLGANGSVVSRTTAKSTGGPIRPAVGGMQGADGLPVPLLAEVRAPVRIGDTDLGPMRLGVCEDVQCTVLLGKQARKVHLGIDAVEGWTVALSYRDRRLWLE